MTGAAASRRDRRDLRGSPRVAAGLLAFLTASAPVDAGVSKWVDIELRRGHVLLETAIEGIPGHSIIDSGAQMTAVNSRFVAASDLEFSTGDPVRITGAFGSEVRESYLFVPVQLFGINARFRDVVSLNLGARQRASQ